MSSTIRASWLRCWRVWNKDRVDVVGQLDTKGYMIVRSSDDTLLRSKAFCIYHILESLACAKPQYVSNCMNEIVRALH